MKKETSVAIFLGISLGLAMAVIMIFKSQRQNTKLITNSNKPTPSVVLNNKLQNLEITEPQDNVIVNVAQIKIKGKSSPDSLIVIQSPVKDLTYKNNKNDFELDFPLALGENLIRITIYPKDTQLRSQEKELRVYYLNE